MNFIIAALSLTCSASLSAQILSVKIVDRQYNDADYTYVVPDRTSSQADSDADCPSKSRSASCIGLTKATSYSLPGQQVSYHVRGTTFSLQLLDGRVAVVNCESKYAERFAGREGNHRSCRQPLVDNIQVEFRGDRAKLEWPVSLDGKKMQSETYRVLGILDRPRSDLR